MTKVKNLLLKEQWVLLLVVIAAISVVTGSVNPRFFSLNNIISILEQISTLGLIASGATILIISGNFDVSVGAVVGLSSCIMAILINLGVPVVLAVSPDLAKATGDQLDWSQIPLLQQRDASLTEFGLQGWGS